MTTETTNGAGEVNPDEESVRLARIHLAAANRIAVLHGLDEGIDNHFTMTVPGTKDRYLLLPFGLHWSEASASNLIVIDESGVTLEGAGKAEISAYCIHAPIHRLTGAQVVMHTHQPWTAALNALEDNRLLPATQSSSFFTPHIAYDDGYAGLADQTAEGERLARVLGNKHILFMKNHGVLVVGDTVAQAYRRLYKIERVCRVQMLALSAGRPIALLAKEMVTRVDAPNPNDTHPRAERERLFFAAMMRLLDRQMPGYGE